MYIRTFIYTDGACSGNGKAISYGGWAFIVDRYSVDYQRRIVYCKKSGGKKPATNNEMELTAVLEALKYFTTIAEFDECLVIVSDSRYFINGMKQKWYIKWKNNGWKNSNGEDVANKELWQNIIDYSEKIGLDTIEFQWIKGHSGHEYNEMADELATAYVEKLKRGDKKCGN